MMDFVLKIYTRDASDNPDYQYFGTRAGLLVDGIEAKNLMNIPTGTSSKITPNSHTASVSSIKCEIVNPNTTMEVSEKIYSVINTDAIMFYRQKAELIGISSDGTESSLFKGIIRGISMDPYETKYTIEVADWFDELKKPVFDRELSDYLTETVADINAHRMPVGFTCSEADEGNTDENSNTVLTRKIVFDGTASEFLKGFYEKIFANEVLGVESGHLGTGWKDFVNESSIDDVTVTTDVTNIYYEWREKIDVGFDFLKEEIYPLLSCYPVIDSDMKIKLKTHRQPTVDEANTITANSQLLIDEAVTLNVTSKTINFSDITNHLIIYDKYKFIDDEFLQSTYYADATSFAKFKKLMPESAMEIELKGIAKADETERTLILGGIRDRIFSRYSLQVVEISVEIPLDKLKFSCGDYILLDNRYIVAWDGPNQGFRGIESETPEEEDPEAKLNNLDNWGAYLTTNSFAWVYGTEVVTLEEEIKSELFNGDGYGSCLENHAVVEAWLTAQGL